MKKLMMGWIACVALLACSLPTQAWRPDGWVFSMSVDSVSISR